jgi:hypothetical protein
MKVTSREAWVIRLNTLLNSMFKVVLIHLCWKGKFILTVFHDISMQLGTIWSSSLYICLWQHRCTRLVFWSVLFCPFNTVKNLIFRQGFPGLVPLLQWRLPGLLLQRLLYLLHLLLRGDCLRSSSCWRGRCFVCCLSSCCSCCLGIVCLGSSCCCRHSCCWRGCCFVCW